MSGSWKNQPASEKQRKYLESLLEQRQLAPGWTEEQAKAQIATATKGQASAWINVMLTRPRKVSAKQQEDLPTPEQLPAGRYAIENEFGDDWQLFKVWRGTRNPNYVKVYEQTSQKGDLKDLPWPEQKAVLKRIVDAGVGDAAERYGLLTGSCGRCDIHLSNALSRLMLVGPECVKHTRPHDHKERVAKGRDLLRQHGIDPYKDLPTWVDLETLRNQYRQAVAS